MKKRPFWLSFIAILTIIGGILTILGSIPVFSLYKSINQGGTTVEKKVSVKNIQSGSPAQGIIQKDDIIIAIDGKLVSTPNDVTVAGVTNGGKQIKITIQREGQNKTLLLTPRALPEPGQGAIGILLANNAIEKKPVLQIIPETLINAYSGHEEEPGFSFSMTRVYQDRSYARLLSLVFGIVGIAIGVGLWKLKKWSWFAFLFLSITGILLLGISFINSLSQDSRPTTIVVNPLFSKRNTDLDLFIDIFSTAIEITMAIYIYKLRPLFLKK